MKSLTIILIVALVSCLGATATAQEFKAGVGRADITPKEPVWLGGYEARKKPSDGVDQKINVKALALQDAGGAVTLIVTADTIGTPREFTEAVAERVERELRVPRERFLFASSHSHATPVLPPALIDMYPLDDAQRAALDRYSDFFKQQTFAAAKAAIESLQPAKLQFSRSQAAFAVNRRTFNAKGVAFGVNPTGLVAHEVPVLRVLGADNSLRAIVFGYACHCTTLGGSYYKVNGDWAGYAQDYLEEAYPGATALFITGCGADANPNPRDNPAFSRQHGLELAGAVTRALKDQPVEIRGSIAAAFERVELPISAPPTKEEFEQRLQDKSPAVQRHAKRHLEMLARGEKLMSSYPCPVQVLRFGSDLTLVGLGGEVVVDYDYRLRRELPNERLWVAGYCNDVFAYVPSMRILAEGGYEAEFNLIYYGLPARFAPEVEETLVKKVIELTKRAAGGAPHASGPAPKSPADSLAAIRVPADFSVELVASEPLTMDPIAFDWGADGKLWVVEMGDYPLGMDGKGKPGGVVRFLEDTDGDGRYDKSTVFLDGLSYPSGLIPWRKGVIVAAAPDIFYAEDSDGDGKADVRRVLFTGFHQGNPQHLVNGLDFGLDGWIYGANGNSGGAVTPGGGGKPVEISKRDFRFRPDDGAFETESGQTQYGRHRDDWGNWFGNSNTTSGWHYILPEHYLRRNPYLTVKELRRTFATYPDATRVFPISPTLKRFNEPGMVNTITSGCSPTPYRDELFGAEFANTLFVCEPVHNLIHREVLEPDGVTFKSHRAPGEQRSEFLASSDNWSRFVYAKTGPDGALYIADMYRFVIEHPEWIPAETQKQLDLRAGHDKGRIYRVFPTGAKLRAIPRLDKLDAAGLVAALDSPNGWQRDTAQRLLVHAAAGVSDPARNAAAVAPLEKLVASSTRPKTRVQALCTLDSLGAVSADILKIALRDAHPTVREHAVRVSEPLLAKTLGEALLPLADDQDIRVRCQLAFTLGEWNDPRAGRALAKIALRDANDAIVQTAAMTSATKHIATMMDAALGDRTAEPPARLLEQLLGLAAAMNDESALRKGLGAASEPAGGKYAAWQFAAVAGVLDDLARRSLGLGKFHSSASRELKGTIDQLGGVFAAARKIAASRGSSDAERLEAIRLLGRGLSERDEDLRVLGEQLRASEPTAIQQAALAALGRAGGPMAAKILIEGWNSYSPSLRLGAQDALFRRSESIGALLSAIEQRQIPSGQISTAHQQKLLGHADAAIRERATKLFNATSADREKVLKGYLVVNDLTGDAARGAVLFRQSCVACHRLREEGIELGPNVAMLADKPAQYFLEAIFDPNKAVESRYLSYTAVTKSNREITGIIATETPNSITMKTAGGSEEAITRSDLRSLTASNISLMPEGLENVLSPQAVADLIAYIKTGPRSAQ